jgi:hypothetical protein
MPWSEDNYPDCLKNLAPQVRARTVDIANTLLGEGFDEGQAIAVATSRAEQWAERRELAMGLAGAADDPAAAPRPGAGQAGDLRRCIDDCLNCHRVCLGMTPYSLETGSHHAGAEHVRLLLDCAEICRTTANFMLRRSSLHAHTCAVCADVCTRCARACEKLQDDARMQACAEVCRRCAESCKQIASRALFGDDR